jgi:hypothetical protein
MKKKICLQCKKGFISSDVTKKRIFCSTKCCQKNYTQKHKKPLQIKNCQHCNKEFSTSRSFQKFCCLKCGYKSEGNQNYQREYNQKRKRIQKIVICMHCNKDFLPKKNGAKYCSSKCYHRSDNYRQMDKKRSLTKKSPKYSEWSDKRKRNKSKYLKYRRKTDPVFKIIANMRSRLGEYIKRKKLKKISKTFEEVGCTPEFLKKYLEKQFKPGMTWENHSRKGWHIDHIIPLNIANTPEQRKQITHYTNLQPLWAEENLKKSNK